MKNISEKQLDIENTVKELRELISYLTDTITHAGEIISHVKKLTSVDEGIKQNLFSILEEEEMVEMPGQATGRDEQINAGNSEPGQATRITY